MAALIPILSCRDQDGYYHITGRMDDVINVTGHRLGTAEVEDAMVSIHVSNWLLLHEFLACDKKKMDRSVTRVV